MSGLWGWLAVATGIVWILVALGLWALQPWARLFAMIMAGFALFEAVLAFFQFPGTGIGFAMAIMPALILWYLSTAEVKAAFGEGYESGPGPTPAAEPAAPAAFAAPVSPAPAIGCRGGGGRRGSGAGAGRSAGHGRRGHCTRGRRLPPIT